MEENDKEKVKKVYKKKKSNEMYASKDSKQGHYTLANFWFWLKVTK